MKKALLITATLLVGALSSMSQIINPDFATWTANFANAAAMDPNSGVGTTGWWDFNVLSGSGPYGGSPVSVFRDNSVVYPGDTYSARIETIVLTATSYTFINKYGKFPDTVGLMFTGNESGTGKYTPKEPFTQELSSLNFYYQYAPVGSDTAFAVVALYHYSGGASHQIAAGILKMTAAASWTLGQIPMFWDSTLRAPDSILIEISSSNLDVFSKSKPQPGSKLWVDHFTTSITGVNDVSAPVVNVNVYPNPASTQVNFQVSGQTAYHADIYDLAGQKMNSYSVSNNFLTINTATYSPGIYFYKLYDQSGAILKVGKLCISR